MAQKAIITSSNWETIAFILIDKVLVLNNPHFTRTQIMSSDNMDSAITISKILGHKKRPTHPEETLQKTIQNLRDKGYIEFFGQGEYKLTEDGFKKMKEEIQAAKHFFKPLASK